MLKTKVRKLTDLDLDLHFNQEDPRSKKRKEMIELEKIELQYMKAESLYDNNKNNKKYKYMKAKNFFFTCRFNLIEFNKNIIIQYKQYMKNNLTTMMNDIDLEMNGKEKKENETKNEMKEKEKDFIINILKKSKILMSFIQSGIADCLFELNFFDKAKKYYDLSLSCPYISENDSVPDPTPYYKLKLGVCEYKLKNYKDAKIYFRDVISTVGEEIFDNGKSENNEDKKNNIYNFTEYLNWYKNNIKI